MTATLLLQQQVKSFLSEVFPLIAQSPRTLCFQLSPKTDREEGHRLSYRLSRQFPSVVVAWENSYFYVLAAQNEQMPTINMWKAALASVCSELPELGDRTWSLREVKSPHLSGSVIGQLAEQVLRVTRPFAPPLVRAEKAIEVRRKVIFDAELVGGQAALSLSLGSRIVLRGTLADFLATHPFRNEPERLLDNLKVEDIDTGSTATITGIVGTIGEMRDQLIDKATGSTSKEALRKAPAEQPVVGVRFGRTSKTEYHYSLAALRPCVTAETADLFGTDYGELLKSTKIPYTQRHDLLQQHKKEASAALAIFGLELRKPLNGLSNPNLFWQPSKPIDATQLLFGNGVVSTSKQILKGLSSGGVYYRHEHYCSQNGSEAQPIRITVLNLFTQGTQPDALISQLQRGLKKYKFDSLLLSDDLGPPGLADPQGAIGRARLTQLINELIVVPTDVFFVFLPTSDRSADDSESGSLYHRIYSMLLRRGVASQFIYEDTLRSTEPRHLLNQIIPGVLAKLGNLPFVLQTPLSVADCFVGLDVARVAKQRLAGSMNACAGVCLYGNQGQFIRARTEGATVEGEEIPLRFLELLLPATDLAGKTVLVYRDGWFRGQEVENLLSWAAAIDAKFILVEGCIVPFVEPGNA